MISLTLFAWLSACHTPGPGIERSATLVYTANVDGDIEPCG